MVYLPADPNAWGVIEPIAIDTALDNIMAQKGSPGGIASLDVTGKIPNTQMPTTTGNIVITSVPCDSSVEVGDAVIMTMDGTAVQASASSFSTSNVIGIADAKESSLLCDIRTSGVSNNVYSGLDPTLDYYLSDTAPGKLTTTPPTASGAVILKIGQPFNSTSLLVSKSLRIIRS